MCSSALSPGPMQVAAEMFTPASLIAAATSARAPGLLSMSMTRSTAIAGTQPTGAGFLPPVLQGGGSSESGDATPPAAREDGAQPNCGGSPMSEPDTLLVMAASYDDLDEAEADYEAVKALYYDVKSSHDFDAAVIQRDEEGKVKVVKKHEQPTRHGVAHGMGLGLAIGAAAAIFPAIGLAGGLVAGGGAGGAIGALRGHMKGGMKDSDLKELGEVLDGGEAGLIVVYAVNMADQIAANIKAANRHI